MHRSKILVLLLLIISLMKAQKQDTAKTETTVTKTIFAYGGECQPAFIKYVAALTHKANPRICFVPTAGADNPYDVNYWYSSCVGLPLQPYVLYTFINSSPEQKTFNETLMSMDAIIVGGGSTLNMLAIWKAQGIDTILLKAYNKGIVLAGGSSGSLCWFKNGLTDSRPKELSYVECLNILKYSHCPHFHSEQNRKTMFEKGMLNGQLTSTAFACDDKAGLLFINGMLTKAVSLNKDNNSYRLTAEKGKVKEELLTAEMIE